MKIGLDRRIVNWFFVAFSEILDRSHDDIGDEEFGRIVRQILDGSTEYAQAILDASEAAEVEELECFWNITLNEEGD